MTLAAARPTIGDACRRALDEARAAARGSPAGTLAEAAADLEDADLLGTFRAARAAGIDAALWLREQDGCGDLGLGTALAAEARGASRLAVLRDAWRAVLSSAAPGAAPRAFVGFSFDERNARAAGPRWTSFPPSVLVLPRLLFERRASRVRVRAVAVAGADAAEETASIGRLLDGPQASPQRSAGRAGCARAESLPDDDRWRAAVASTVADVRAGRVEKAVLARAVRVRGSIDVDAALSRLAARSLGSTVFAVSRGGRCFLGATPESLVRLRDGLVSVSCVAGTAPRDGDPARDAARARELAASAKEREEHAIVAREAAAALGPLCVDVESGDPRPVPVTSVWHLVSEVRGRARPDVDLFALAQALHPTPAVCGHPRDAALAIVAGREPFDRGWYAGALGWVDAEGEGELAVALRSALCAPGEAWLFAGCGIVAGSDPGAELAESEAKLRPMLEALGAA